MQILASALPGFRDLRAPVIAGYMWLVFAWLIVQPDPDHRPDDSIGAALYDLGHAVGRIWVAVAISVIAYLLGSLSLAVSNSARRVGQHFSVLFYGFDVGSESFLRPSVDRAEAAMGAANESLSREAMMQIEAQWDNRNTEAIREADHELDLPAILLVGDRPELFAEVDRLRGEADLRTAVAFPLAAFAVLLALEVSGWWLALLPASATLFFQGIERDSDARKAISDAIRLGRAPSTGSAKLEEWVDKDLPALIEKSNGTASP